MICVPLLGRDPAHRDRPIRTGRRDKPIIQLPSIALRVAVIVGIAAVMFGIVFFRLWFLQILSGQEFVAQANDNRLSSVKVVAPRGYIVDRNGKVIVGNRAGEAVGIRLMDVPKGKLEEELARLAPVLDVKPGALRKRIKDYLYPSTLEQNADGTWTSFLTWKKVTDGEITGLDLIVLKHDVSRKVMTYLKERTLQFPGVEIQDDSLRSYPQGDMAAQVLGHLGEISAEQLKTQHFKGYSGGDVVGYDGLEYTYDKWLRGRDGVARIEVDAFGRPKQTEPVGGRMPDPGDTLVTTLDSKVQAAAEQALRTGISLAHANKQYEANGAAAVVMDVKNGDVLGMASYPTFDPNVWVGGMKPKTYKRLTRKSANNPLHESRRPRRPRRSARRSRRSTSVAGPRGGRHHPGNDILVPRLLHLAERPRRSPAEVQVLGAGRPRESRPHRRHHAVVRRLLLQRRQHLLQSAGRGPGGLGQAPREWANRPGSTSPSSIRGASRRRSGRRAGRASRPRSTRSGSPATRSISPSGRATSRRRRCSSPPPTRRSPTGARS